MTTYPEKNCFLTFEILMSVIVCYKYTHKVFDEYIAIYMYILACLIHSGWSSDRLADKTAVLAFHIQEIAVTSPSSCRLYEIY